MPRPPMRDDDPRPVRGSCLCGEVHFEIAGEMTPIQYCYASRCRKAGGGAFAPEMLASRAGFRWLAGASRVRHYEAPILHAPPAYRRAFCEVCGAPVPAELSGTEYLLVNPGGLDGDPRMRPSRHAFTGQCPPWHRIEGELPRFAEQPPVPEAYRPAPAPAIAPAREPRDQALVWRRAGVADRALLARLNRRLQEDEGSAPMPPAALEARLERWLAGPYRAVLFFESGAEPVAYALYRPSDVDAEGPDAVFVRQFLVAPAARGRGIGRQAFELLAAEVFPAGHEILLDALASNPAGLRFWRRLGFREHAARLVRSA